MRRLLASAMAILVLATLPPIAGAEEVSDVSVAPADLRFSPGAGAVTGSHAVLWSTGAAWAFTTTTFESRQVAFEIVSRQCEGAPHLEVAVDGVTAMSQKVYAGAAYPGDLGSEYAVPGRWSPGRHKITFRFLNDHRTASCDRNVEVAGIRLSSDPVLLTQQSLVGRTVMVEPPSAGAAGPGRSWRGQAKLWNNGTVRFRLDSQRSTTFLIWLRAVRCAGWTAHLTVTMDGEQVYDGQLPHEYAASNGDSTGYFRLDRTYADGPHDVTVTMSKDLRTPTCDRSVVLTDVHFRSVVPDGLS